MSKFRFLVSALVLAFLVGCSDSSVANSGEKLAGEKLSAIQADNKEKEKFLVVDVRTKDEYDKGHLKHAINIPLENLEARLDELKGYENKDIILYCNTGNRSGKATNLLKEKGFSKVLNADGVKDFNYELYKFGSLNAAEFEKLNKDEILIIDVREPKDFEAGHMKNAINIPDGEPVENYAEILEANKDKKIVVHCYTGNRSAKLAEKLTEMGFSDVNNLLDGTKEYNYELVK